MLLRRDLAQTMLARMRPSKPSYVGDMSPSATGWNAMAIAGAPGQQHSTIDLTERLRII